MAELSGRLMARLADAAESYDLSLIDEINTRVNPPQPVTADDVHIRAMYVVSDQINSQGGCFAPEDMDQLALLLADSPVMVGHRRDTLPVARNFRAEKINLDGRWWVKSYFYWMRQSDGADDLKNNIDGGIYKECSISFLFGLPECGICGEDIRRCQHIPFYEYDTSSGEKVIAHFKYRRIEKVLETSLVFRGAIPDTRITDKLSPLDTAEAPVSGMAVASLFTKEAETASSADPVGTFGDAPFVFIHQSEWRLPPDAVALYRHPYQPGLIVRVAKSGDDIKLTSNLLLPEPVRNHIVRNLMLLKCSSMTGEILLYATRGRDRMNGLAFLSVLYQKQRLHRPRIRLCDLLSVDGLDLSGRKFSIRQEQIIKLCAGVAMARLEPLRPAVMRRDSAALSGQIPGGEYRFGLEILSENLAGQLQRHVLLSHLVHPAIIESPQGDCDRHGGYTASALFDSDQIWYLGRMHQVDINRGTICLVRPNATGATDSAKSGILWDILPGAEAHAVPEGYNRTVGRLYYRQGESSLTLSFSDNGVVHSIVVHHFTPRLFAMNRRFVADHRSARAVGSVCLDGDSVPLNSIRSQGKLILLRLAESTSLFGTAAAIWLRPILLDGEERYLFHGDRIRDLGEEE